MTTFGTLQPDGSLTNGIRVIHQSDLMKCPNVILVSEHYLDDGTCKCYDPSNTIMKEWGYTWNGELWA